ncbi:MAG: PHP domain-containing protein [Gemmatimonadota bacterium]|nr:PHP domain-containing protein [Gemmatimonadota bacterium]
MASYIDLHLHSTKSDGSFSPTQVVQRAAELGVSAISLTDHDSVAGVQEAQNIGRDIGVEVIPGIELSAQEAGIDIHILGYFIDPTNSDLLAYIQKFQDARRNRAEKIVARLNRLGVRITIAQVLHKAGDATIGRPHVADVLVEEGFVFSHDHAFQKYLGYGKPAYQPKYVLTPREAVEVIHAAGGLASLAHPVLYRRDALIPDLIKQGLDGLEVMHVKHDHADVRRYSDMAQHYDLLTTGGSDCHGDGRGQAVMGTVRIPLTFLAAMKKKLAQ